MRLPKIGLRHRILAACLSVGLGAIGLLTASGLVFSGLVRRRARESCNRVGTIFAGIAHDRLVALVAEAAALAKALAQASALPAPGDRSQLPAPTAKSLICSWALYDADGRRLESRRAGSAVGALDRLGIGTPQVVARERARLAEALAGRPSTVLVPDGRRVYALNYQPIVRDGEPRAALQVATELAGSLFPSPHGAGGARAVLRPFVAHPGSARLVTLDGEPQLIVYRPLACGGRQLGTIAAAVPYSAEARYEQAVVFFIVVVAAGATLVLAVVSHLLTNIAMVPLDRVRHFVRRLQTGGEVGPRDDIPDDEAGALFEAYKQLLAESDSWAEQLVESSRANHELLRGAMEALVSAIEAKDVYTAGHSQRVADTACRVARELGWDAEAIEQLRLGSLLHDIGKIGISLEVLDKRGRLTPEEMEIVRQHPVIGARILSSIPGCEEVVRTVLYHHETFDGTGYPTGAKGADIPRAARIVALADIYDALTSRRSYRPPYSPEEALEIMTRDSGKVFDPELIQVFIEAQGHDLPPLCPVSSSEATSQGERDTRHADRHLAATAEERS